MADAPHRDGLRADQRWGRNTTAFAGMALPAAALLYFLTERPAGWR